MKKPITTICLGISGVGGLILVAWFYYALAYGHGDFEAGNFHRCQYWSERDSASGKLVKRWERNWELTESTEGSPVYNIDIWLVGIGLVFLGGAIWTVDWAYSPKARSGI